MARMAIDDSVFRDPRITALAMELGWSRRETVGVLLEVWAICYDQRTAVVHARAIDVQAGREGFAMKLVSHDLAKRHPSGRIVIRGASERVAYLDAKREAGRQGGLKSAESRRTVPKHAGNHSLQSSEAPGNPPDLVPSPDPDLVPERDRDPVPDPRSRAIGAPSPTVEISEGEAADVRWVLGKLAEDTGVAYSANAEQTRVVVERLREGYVRADLAKIAAYAVDELHWNDEKMRGNLRPHVLFSRERVLRLVDEARSWAKKHGGGS